MKGQYSIRFVVDGHCVTLTSDSLAVQLKVARVLQERLGCGSSDDLSGLSDPSSQSDQNSPRSPSALEGAEMRRSA